MKNLGLFFSEVRSEMSKVVWPSRAEFLGSVVVVVITMVAFSVFLGLVNTVFYTGALKGFQYLILGR